MSANNENTLSNALLNSIIEPTVDLLVDYTELGLDSLLDDVLLKEIPIVSTARAIYKIGNTIRERSHIKKLVIFIQQLQKCIVTEEKREEYRKKFLSNPKFKEAQVEYLIVILDRYINYEKPKLLAMLYLAFITDKIKWQDFMEYAEILERILMRDFELLIKNSSVGGFKNEEISNISAVLRLLSLGFIEQITGMADTKPSSKYYYDYYITDFGKQFVEIFSREI